MAPSIVLKLEGRRTPARRTYNGIIFTTTALETHAVGWEFASAMLGSCVPESEPADTWSHPGTLQLIPYATHLKVGGMDKRL